MRSRPRIMAVRSAGSSSMTNTRRSPEVFKGHLPPSQGATAVRSAHLAHQCAPKPMLEVPDWLRFNATLTDQSSGSNHFSPSDATRLDGPLRAIEQSRWFLGK